jgi:hypothetical protein
MNAKVLTLAMLLAAVIALPVPASQMLAGTSSVSPTQPSPAAEPGTDLGLLLQDPFLIDTLSFKVPASFLDTATGAPAPQRLSGK